MSKKEYVEVNEAIWWLAREAIKDRKDIFDIFQTRIPREDVEPVVRCKDCKYYKWFKRFDTMICTHKDISATTFEYMPIDKPYFVPDENFYCSLGERKA